MFPTYKSEKPPTTGNTQPPTLTQRHAHRRVHRKIASLQSSAPPNTEAPTRPSSLMLHTCTISAIGCKRARWLGPRPLAAGSQAASIIHRAPSIIHRAAFSSILPYEIVRTCRGLRGCGSIPTSSESVHLAALSQIRSRLGQHRRFDLAFRSSRRFDLA